MNIAYIGSVAERNIKFLSTLETVKLEDDDLFNSFSIYVPSHLAAENIADYDPSWVSSQQPLVLQCDVTNYKKQIKGRLLDQWQNIFRQDTNTSVVLYVIVFLCDQSTAGEWEIDDVSITFGPLTRAFNALFHISWFKTLFDPYYDGRAVPVEGTPGTPASAVVVLGNSGSGALTVAAGSYVFNDGVKDWTIVLAADVELDAGASYAPIQIYAATVGSDAALAPGTVPVADLTPNAGLTGLTITISSVTQGTDAVSGQSGVPSQYFDLSLALAYQAKQDTRLSCVASLIKVALPAQSPDVNACWIRTAPKAVQTREMRSIAGNDRAKYYWGALYLMSCRNTWVIAHSEDANIFVEVMAQWFKRKNASGQFVGNKLSHIRLTGNKIKPFGYPSWLDDQANVNDADAFDSFDEMDVSYLRTISSSSKQDSSLSRARGVLGDSINAMMIGKYVDYTAAQKCADMIDDDGTLTDPVLTDEDAYKKIQQLFQTAIQAFTRTRRITGIRMTFPEFSQAKKGLVSLEAVTAWSANYTDELDSVTITGGIVEA
jgi:hypothetical protein